MKAGMWAPAVLLAVVGSCSAQEAWRGIWEGTIGQMPVRVCFDGNGGDDSRYYYLKYGKDILLQRAKDEEGSWLEGDESADKPGGKWRVSQDGADTMRGTWQNSSTSKQLPIVLKRTVLPLGQERSLCEAEYFFKPVADAARLVAGPVQAFGRHSYQKLATRVQKRGDSNFEPEAVVLRDFGANGAAVNEQLQARLRKRLAQNHDTRMNGLMESTEEVVWLSDRWLSMRETEWPKGHGISSISMWFETWDLSTGARFDLWRWFNASAGAWHEETGNDGVEQVFTPSKALSRAIGRFGDNGGDPGCKGQDKSWSGPRLAPGGIEFEAGYGPCMDIAVASFKKLRPFLNEEGLRQAAALQREAVKP